MRKSKSRPFSKFINYPTAGGWSTNEVVELTGLDKPQISRIKTDEMLMGMHYYYQVGQMGKVCIMYSDDALQTFMSIGKKKKR